MTNNKLTDEPMGLDAAIIHADERAASLSGPCAEQHAQLANWLRELQERRKADSTVFMYGIVTPDGDAYMEEFCVSNDLGLMEDEASALNDSFDTDGYRAVALYTASPAPTAPLVPEPATVETTYPDVQTNWQDAKMYAKGWNACRTAMLATAQ